MATALLEQPLTRPLQIAELLVQPADIVFRNVAPGRVRLTIRVANLGDAPSEPTALTVQAAPLGAFVPWKDVTALAVPAIQPHNHAQVVTELSAPTTRALGQFSRVPPRKLLTALAGDDDADPPANPAVGLARFFTRLLGGRATEQPARDLQHDPLQLLSRPNVHWAGNINVLIGQHAVERHLAQALRIYPGQTNLAIFLVGDRRDEYQFALAGSGAAWDAALFDYTDRPSLTAPRSASHAIPRSQWIPMNSCRAILLAICPPSDAESGSVEVHIRQRSTRKDALVEFSLDAHAAGPGCYTV